MTHNIFFRALAPVCLAAALAMTAPACRQIDELSDRVDAVESGLADLEAAVAELADACRTGRMVESVTEFEESGVCGWTFVFSDGSQVRIVNDARVVSAVEEDPQGQSIIIRLADGTAYTLRLSRLIPTSIALLNPGPLELTLGGSVQLGFRLNPSNSESCLLRKDAMIELDLVGKATRSSFVTESPNLKVERIEHATDAYGKEIPGQFVMTIVDRRKAAGYDEYVSVVLSCRDAFGEEVHISSDAIEVKGDSRAFVQTGLPVVFLDTPDAAPILSKEIWLEGASMMIVNPDYSIEYEGTLAVKGRGNSTWGAPKNPYSLKLDKKSTLFGLPKHKRWCLLANLYDRTLIRNAVAFEISRKTDLAWTPSGRHVELVLNGRHLGNYYLCEQIKVDENRVAITELDPDATEGEALEGGYIFELDTYYDEEYKFKSSRRNLPFQFKDPDVVNQAQFDYGVHFVNEMELSMYDYDRFMARDFVNYIDLGSFIDFFFVNELAGNGEIKYPKSTYMYKDKGGKMFAGPVWDFDWGSFLPEMEYKVRNYLYYNRLFYDKEFCNMVKERWNRYKPGFLEVADFIDAQRDLLRVSDAINSDLWESPIKMNGDENLDFDAAVARLKKAYLDKLEWLDIQISAL